MFTGCVKDWAALAKWNPSNGGLDYLQVFFFQLCFVNYIIGLRSLVGILEVIFLLYKSQNKKKIFCF